MEGSSVSRLGRETRKQQHPDCFVCCQNRIFGLQVHYEARPNGEVEATVSCPEAWKGYPDWVHGGITAALLDGAMTNCLFAQGIVAVTAELRVRYRSPLMIGKSARITAALVRHSSALFVLEAAITQQGQVRATSTGKFLTTQERVRR